MVLQTTGSGTQWVATSSLGIGGSIAPDSLNFTEFSDSLVVDANTTLDVGSNSLSISSVGGFNYLNIGSSITIGDSR